MTSSVNLLNQYNSFAIALGPHSNRHTDGTFLTIFMGSKDRKLDISVKIFYFHKITGKNKRNL